MTERAIDRAYIEAYRYTFEVVEAEGRSAMQGCTDDLTDEALEIATDRFHLVLPAYEAEASSAEATERVAELVAANSASSQRYGRKRRRFSQAMLSAYALTQPPDVCQRCGAVSPDGPQELDHMMEMVYGGPDHPHNLIRLCSRCHRDKPLPSELEDTFVGWRLAIITWVFERPLLRWWDEDEMADYRKSMRSLYDQRYP